jgi:small subunit ribosomal protein S9
MATTERAYATGRRKESTARVYLTPGEGKVVINGREMSVYLRRKTLEMIVLQPFEILEQLNRFDVAIRVAGGGLSGQAGAIRHGISRALLKTSPDNRGVLKKAGMLTRDSREVERKKYGQPKARKRYQFSKR